MICFTLALCESFDQSVANVIVQTKKLKTSLYPHSVKALAQLIAWFPGIVGQLVMMWVASKSTMVLSNVPGPKKALAWPGVQSIGFGALIPGLGDLAIGVSAMSMGDRM